MSNIKITFTDPLVTVSLGTMGENKSLNVNDTERRLIANLSVIAWQNAKTIEDCTTTLALVDDIETITDNTKEINLSSEKVERLAEAYVSLAGQRPGGWRLAGKSLLKQIFCVKD